jgi:tetratricopeptide (TPR) repeat protein
LKVGKEGKMRNKVFTVLAVLVIATSLIVGCQTVPKMTESTIQEAKGTLTLRDSATVIKSLEAKNIDKILILPDDQIDLATAVLLISQKTHRELYKSDIDIQEYRHKVDEMASALFNRMGKEKSPEGMIRVMSHYIEELNFSIASATEEDFKPSFLTFMLDEKRGDCLGLSILYLSIAERIGLSLFGVVAPGHAFVRYEDNVKRINIETTNKGETARDDFYIDKFKIPRGSQFYLKSLGKKQMIGVFLYNAGIAYYSKGFHDQAISDYNKALEINPRYALPYYNMALSCNKAGRVKEAIQAYRRFIQYAPATDRPNIHIENARKGIIELDN